MGAEGFANVCSMFQCLLSVAQEGGGGDGGLEAAHVEVLRRGCTFAWSAGIASSA